MEQSFYNINYATQPPPQFSQTPLQSMQSLPPILQSPPTPPPSSSSQPNIVDKTIIFVKNFPIDFKKIEIRELLTKFGAINVKCKGKHSAFAKFSNELEAKEVLNFLHQKQINNYLLIAEYGKIKDFNNTASDAADNDNDIDNNNQQINNKNNINNDSNDNTTLKLNNFVKLLNSTNMDLNFEQPPPPHLKYLYPKVNRNIIDSISIALETYPKFYVQVLHLMNRFNLEPPFIYGAQKLDYPKTLKSIGTQTEAQTLDATLINDRTLLEKIRKITDLASDESELESSVHTSSAIESDEEDNLTIIDDLKKIHNRKRRRRQQHHQQQQLNKKHNLKRFRSIFDSEKNRQINNNYNNSNVVITSNYNNNIKNKIKSIDTAFVDKPMSINKTITIKTPTQLQQTDTVNDTEIVKSIKSNQLNDGIRTNSCELEQINNNKIHILSDKELYENRLPNNQLLSNPLFLNYKIGERSNKLYIKNLAKTVTENDLKSIYYRYLRKPPPPNNNKDVDDAAVATVEAASDNEIHIRLMKTGRMKGQAFITFNQPYLDDDNYRIVEKAISDTNGFILKDKIMIVNYGKKGT